MKRHLYMICALMAVVLVSCSQRQDQAPGQGDLQEVTLTLNFDDQDKAASRASGIRYVIQAYSGMPDESDGPALIFDNLTTHNATSTDGVFTMQIDRTKNYQIYCWADINGQDVYDVSDMSCYGVGAKLKAGKAPTEAWYLNAGGYIEGSTLSGTLQRAVSKLQIKETGKLKAGTSLKMTFDQNTRFAIGGTASGKVSRTETITIASDINGTPSSPVVLGGDIFVLSNHASADVTKFTFKVNEEEPFEVDNVPLRANYKTNIRGHFTSKVSNRFEISSEAEWDTPDIIVPVKYPVGWYVYFDRTCISTFTYSQSNPCLGVVYWNDPNNENKVRIISAKYNNSYFFSTDVESDDVPGAYSETDGRANTVAYDVLNTASDYDQVIWCKQLSGRLDWYLPAIKELTDDIYPSLQILNQALGVIDTGAPLSGNQYSSTMSRVGYLKAVNYNNGTPVEVDGMTTVNAHAVAELEIRQESDPAPYCEVGYFVYADKTCAPTFEHDAANGCLGVVYWIDPNNARNVKVLSQMSVNTYHVNAGLGTLDFVNAHDADDGELNKAGMLNDPNYEEDESNALGMISPSNGFNVAFNWYVPAINELKMLVANKHILRNALKTIEAGGDFKFQVAYSSTYFGPGAMQTINYVDGTVDFTRDPDDSNCFVQYVTKLTLVDK